MSADRAGSVRAAAITLMTVVMAASPRAARGQDAGPIVVNPRPEWEWFRLQELDAALELEWRRQVDEIKPTGEPGERDVEDRFREILDLSGQGYSGHPNLFQLSFRARLGLTQRNLDLESIERSERINETLIDYNLSALILQKQKTPVTIYTRRTENDINRQFGGSLENVITEHGIRLNILHDVLPVNILYFHRDQDQVDSFGATQFNLVQDTLQLDGRIKPEGGHTFWWDYSFDDINESGELRPARSFQRHEANVTHSWDFGADEQHNLRSTARYFSESGDIDFQQIRLNSILRMKHSRSLTAWYEFLEEHVDRHDTRQIIREGRMRFRHRLFDSLITTGQLGLRALEVTNDDFTSEEYFGDLVVDYTKQVPLGRLNAGADLRFSHRDESPRGAAIQITDELQVFDGAGRITIRARNILVDSIRITDVSGVFVYREGSDYTVRGFADRVEIRRVSGGDIADGQPVLVDYLIGPEPGGVTTGTGWGVNVRYTFQEGLLRGLSFYAILFEQSEDRPEEFIALGGIPSEFTDLTYGVEYDVWKLRFEGQRQIHDSLVAPFEAMRLEGSYTERLGRGSALSFNAYYDEIDNTDINLRTTTTTLTGAWSQQITERLYADLRLTWRRTEDSDQLDTEAFEQYVELMWRHHQTTVVGRLRNALVDSTSDERNFQELFVGIRRDF